MNNYTLILGFILLFIDVIFLMMNIDRTVLLAINILGIIGSIVTIKYDWQSRKLL